MRQNTSDGQQFAAKCEDFRESLPALEPGCDASGGGAALKSVLFLELSIAELGNGQLALSAWPCGTPVQSTASSPSASGY